MTKCVVVDTRRALPALAWRHELAYKGGMRKLSPVLLAPLLLSLYLLSEAAALAAPQKTAPSAEESARSFLEQVEGKTKPANGQPAFTTRGCKKLTPTEWARVLLMDQPVKLELKFAPECDLEGTLNVRKAGFPVDLKLRHVAGTDRARGKLTPEVGMDLMDSRMDVDVRLSDGSLSRSGAADYLKFNGNYSLVLGAALGGPQPVSIRQNKGGKLAVNQYQTKPAQAEVPFKIE